MSCYLMKIMDVLNGFYHRTQLHSTAFRLASTNVDSVVNGNVQVQVSRQMKESKTEEFDESIVWQEVLGLVAIKTFLQAHGDVFDLEEQGENVMMSLRATTHSTDQTQRSAALPPFTTNVGVWQRSGQVHWDTSVVCLSTLKALPRSGFTLWVSPAELRWTHNKIQRQFSCGKAFARCR